ncbi:efflux RND transporter periplasmic adaptor subunit [Massilia sp. BHUDP2]|uniref:efflux RND transporter periplasmic adaptor subunit n=1 Tax=Massilia sp. BHUDP2 TaxID=3034505 RepID=UPI003906094B
MKFNINQKNIVSILLVLAVGAVLALAIFFWKKDVPAKQGAGESEHSEQSAGKSTGSEEGHANEQPGIVEMTPQQAQLAGITLATASSSSIDVTVTLPGEVRFNEDRTAHIVPRVAGVVETVSATLGQDVTKGQQLAMIASPELAELRGQANAAAKRLELARLTYEREKKLWQDRISAEQDYQQARQAYSESQIELQSARSKLAALGAEPGSGSANRYVLRAPFTGVVVEKHLSQGEAVKEDANAFLVSDLSSVWVEMAVTAKDLGHVRVGQPVTIRPAGGDTTVAGKVSYVGNLLGEQTRTATARVVIANPGRAWRPGLFVSVELVRGKTEAPVTVLASALQEVEGKQVVFLKAQNGFKAQPVKTGASDGNYVAIAEGITAGTQYVATGSFVVKAEQAKGSAEHGH